MEQSPYDIGSIWSPKNTLKTTYWALWSLLNWGIFGKKSQASLSLYLLKVQVQDPKALACEEVFKSSEKSIWENLYKGKQSTLHPQQSSENISINIYICIYIYSQMRGTTVLQNESLGFSLRSMLVSISTLSSYIISPKRNGIRIIPDSSISIFFSAETSAATLPPPPGFWRIILESVLDWHSWWRQWQLQRTLSTQI